jgi:hypothetical protein
MAINSDTIKQFLSTDLIPVAEKTNGTTRGYIGKHKDSLGEYLVKYGPPGYLTTISQSPNDIVVLECLGSELIRLILEVEPWDQGAFVADTIPVMITKPNPGTGFNSYDEYGLASKILKCHLNKDESQFATYSPELATRDRKKLSFVAHLLGVADIQIQHLVPHYQSVKTRDGLNKFVYRTAIVDCAVDLKGHKQNNVYKKLATLMDESSLELENHGDVLNIFRRITKIKDILMEAVDRYTFIEVSDSCSNETLKKQLSDLVHYVTEHTPILEQFIEENIQHYVRPTRTSFTSEQDYMRSFFGSQCDRKVFLAHYPMWSQSTREELKSVVKDYFSNNKAFLEKSNRKEAMMSSSSPSSKKTMSPLEGNAKEVKNSAVLVEPSKTASRKRKQPPESSLAATPPASKKKKTSITGPHYSVPQGTNSPNKSGSSVAKHSFWHPTESNAQQSPPNTNAPRKMG